MKHTPNNVRLERRAGRWKTILVLSCIALLGVFWLSALIGKIVMGDVPAAYANATLRKNALFLWHEIMCNPQQPARSIWPNNAKETSTEFFQRLREYGYISDRGVAAIVKPRKALPDHPQNECFSDYAHNNSLDTIMNHDNVEWVVAIGCDGQLFSETNKPAENLPFLMTRNVAGTRWIPSMGVSLVTDRIDSKNYVVVITFGGKTVGKTVRARVRRTKPDMALSDFESITNILILARP